MNSYVYIKSEPGLWTVGFYDPSGKWQPESDHVHRDAAAERVHYLNGGNDGDGESESTAETIRKNSDANRWSK